MANTIQIKRGASASLPTLAAGELGFSTDTKQLHIGDGSVNHEVVMADLFNTGTFLYATSDNTPAAKTRAEVMSLLSGQAGANFAMNSKKITGLADPSSAQDAATKAYADTISGGVDPKDSCRVATTTALPSCNTSGSGVGKTLTATSTGVLTIDGVSTVLNDRILVKNQSAGSDNGVYKVTTEGTSGVAFVLTRATDYDEDTEVTGGAYCFITEGTANADQGWILTTNDPITVDTTVLAFTQFSGTGDVVAGTGMTKSGSTLNVIGGTGITANADDIAHTPHTGDVTGATALTIVDDAVTYAKMQNVADTDKILGRSSAGAGAVEEIACTTAGRALLDDADVSAQRTTLGAAKSGANSDITELSGLTTDLSITQGGTGASDAAGAKTNLGFMTDVVDDTSPQLGGILDSNAHQIRWSKGADVASAPALTLGTDGNYFDVTGTTAITSIATLGIGTVVMLHFDDVLTLTHHTTDLILPAAVDITTAAGDEAMFVEYASGDWRCISYSGSGHFGALTTTSFVTGEVIQASGMKHASEDDVYIGLYGGVSDYNPSILLFGKNQLSYHGMIRFAVPNTAKNGTVTVMEIPGASDTPILELYYGLDMNSKAIDAVLDPTTSQQAATKNYCDTRTIDGGAFA